MSLKDKGNEAFKRQKYEQAIKLYDEYVVQQHPDNKNAFVNMALCYSKLKDHQKSIEASKSALAIDPTCEKAYYRLMKQYFEVKNPYQVFVNARLYIKNEKDQQSPQIIQAKEYMKAYKDYFINKIAKQQIPKKLDDKDEIFKLVEPLQNIPEQNDDYNEQIDKYPNEWIEQWTQDIQSEDAKWEEIAYIIRDLDYNTGISLAYFYLNQASTPHKKRVISEKIKAIKAEMNVEKVATDDQNQTKNAMQVEQLSSKQQISFSKTQAEKNLQNLLQSKPKNRLIDQNVQKKVQKINQEPNKEKEIQKPAQKSNKIHQLLQKKSQNKKQYEQPQETTNPTIIEKPKLKQSNVKNHPIQTKPLKKQQQAKGQKVITTTIKQQRDDEQVQSLYKNYCGQLQKTKDLFVQCYKSVYSILNGKQSAATIGKLLILIKKRVKKFKLIVTAFSDNEQTVLFDLLSKKGLEEYAIDFAPKHYKL